ncbi:alpha/beta-hydrolase [Hyaloscypha variabilis F]|uniref:Alpha/beta-hydrolase n=1 Tax=Hyaloscypha variabilis (strain UAMH 11265 / GT02V1 / F) TaxID=1149755 RepID=A0A2J6RR17_HYAVF|nr:alpha/beta-hydrolase [Hyaloscypha variabilis F]
MSESKPAGIEHTKKTLPIKKIQGQDLMIDVYYTSSAASTPRPAILFFHGGFLISGDSNALPNWLLQASLRRNWTIISANYRCIPESSAFEIASDLVAAYDYVSTSLSSNLNKPGLIDPSRIIVAGHSGGGYCAVLSTLEVMKSSTLKKPVATVAIYPMLNFLSPKWAVEGIDFGGLSDQDAEAGRKDLERRLAAKEISFGEKFAESEALMVHHTRWNMMRYVVKKALFVDYFSGISGLGKKIAAAQPVEAAAYEKFIEEIVPEDVRHLFVVDFGNLKAEMPPLFVVHGLADTAVPFEDSNKLTEKTRALGVPTKYWQLEGYDHDFDLGFPDLEVIELEKSDDEYLGKKAIKEVLQGLDEVVGK